jgi:predicted nucleic acid-binding protein
VADKLCIVDTSIFIDFFRNRSANNDLLKQLISEDQVILSAFVKIELILGVRHTERSKLNRILDGFRIIIPTENFYERVFQSLPNIRQSGINFGLGDLLIVIQAKEAGVGLFTRDKMMKKLCKMLAVKVVD